jgi:hypothetical protein
MEDAEVLVLLGELIVSYQVRLNSLASHAAFGHQW